MFLQNNLGQQQAKIERRFLKLLHHKMPITIARGRFPFFSGIWFALGVGRGVA